MGVIFMGGLSFFQRDRKIHSRPPAGLWGAPVLGMTFGLGWAPCIGPTFSAVQALAYSGGADRPKGPSWPSYCLGMGIPFLLIALGVRRGMGAMAFFRKHRLFLQRAGGAMLVVLGLLMATGLWGDWVTQLQDWFANEVRLPTDESDPRRRSAPYDAGAPAPGRPDTRRQGRAGTDRKHNRKRDDVAVPALGFLGMLR